jgi:hypothetical protein
MKSESTAVSMTIAEMKTLIRTEMRSIGSLRIKTHLSNRRITHDSYGRRMANRS